MSAMVLDTLASMRALAERVRQEGMPTQDMRIAVPIEVHFYELKRTIVETTLLQMEMLAAIEIGEQARAQAKDQT